ncbi:nuclear transport factor 2 family protein [Nocardia pseudovaccinii]|uniref:nuclear transport factor 2 family protein n=1 Tax=Nocardia pseudovaccinii TaxID=189540 RepID=UPI0007A4E1E1|nr:nuclear transport factor 2 family protein [Nocardia pseudovaccinii]
MRDFGITLFDEWTAMWNGDLALAHKIMAPEFTLRYAQPGASEYDTIRDPQTLAAKVAGFRAQRPGIRFTTQGEPVVEMDDTRTGFVARPYGASFTGPDGEQIEVSGTDILRVTAGQITEVWSASGGPSGRTYY